MAAPDSVDERPDERSENQEWCHGHREIEHDSRSGCIERDVKEQ